MTDTAPLSTVETRTDGDRWTLVFTRDLRHPPEKVWAALTDPAQVSAWAPFTADRNLGEATSATLTMLDAGTAEELAATVRRAQRPTLLEYTWGDDLLRWELTATAGGTRLTLHHTLDERETVPQVAAGWHLCLDVAERLLDGDPVPPVRGRDALDHGWQDLHDRYREQLS